MKKDYDQTNERPVRGDEGKIIATSLILFIASTILRYLGPDGASCL
ncbi:hypothetical protein J2Y45_002397 [Dyadobacter sp. BE34]|uniref:Uncharacterized protein n=1 Tax=Dyadobacter fermentans TaxID=94254 RepID=A0ABU1QVW6_9BACT|nr:MULTISPECIES: hypothetical protein [Dyadobacter]MDR6805294.1 hypothetical protein [Dyadobacter fermentans]MDR7042946.1 hypothetical protein [Dyadobacter sp. BE242]MDR7197258.1 hypothetical protein [Dyadobacter sp. BE34]MDR7215307.1 hypothetical protein [Dyadobacter sp. BE31]MDR7262843.1 hypothetical protein [Dyadobacter sp. BE32]